jgi:hypothetical protein
MEDNRNFNKATKGTVVVENFRNMLRLRWRFNGERYSLTAVRGFKSPGSKTGKFCVGVKSPLQNLITNYELRITNYLTLGLVNTPENRQLAEQKAHQIL